MKMFFDDDDDDHDDNDDDNDEDDDDDDGDLWAPPSHADDGGPVWSAKVDNWTNLSQVTIKKPVGRDDEN